MAKVVVLGVKGEEGYWLVDFGTGSVSPLPSLDADPFGYSAAARAAGAVLTSGIDLAVLAPSSDDAFAGRFDTGPFAGRFDG